MTIWFDMDGTIANLYAVDGWLEMLRNEDATPYEVAAPLLNMNSLARQLNALTRKGYKIGIISWTAKHGSDLYNGQVAMAKLLWLHKHLASVQWDEIKIVPYGTNKYTACGGGILFDDEENNRETWQELSYNPSEITTILHKLNREG